jgi:hypothetical protein
MEYLMSTTIYRGFSAHETDKNVLPVGAQEHCGTVYRLVSAPSWEYAEKAVKGITRIETYYTDKWGCAAVGKHIDAALKYIGWTRDDVKKITFSAENDEK